jgi:hypothetical protein
MELERDLHILCRTRGAYNCTGSKFAVQLERCFWILKHTRGIQMHFCTRLCRTLIVYVLRNALQNLLLALQSGQAAVKLCQDMSLLPDRCFSVVVLEDCNTFIILYYV